jgi:hypothetical protein
MRRDASDLSAASETATVRGIIGAAAGRSIEVDESAC